jgi:hypothetical protein
MVLEYKYESLVEEVHPIVNLFFERLDEPKYKDYHQSLEVNAEKAQYRLVLQMNYCKYQN